MWTRHSQPNIIIYNSHHAILITVTTVGFARCNQKIGSRLFCSSRDVTVALISCGRAKSVLRNRHEFYTATFQFLHRSMLDTEIYRKRGKQLLIRGVIAGLAYATAVLTPLFWGIFKFGICETLALVAVAEVLWIGVWTRKCAQLSRLPDRHSPDHHDPSASFKRFKAMITAERAQVCSYLVPHT